MQVDPGQATWWTRPCGGRDVLRLALPLVISTISTTVMMFTDRMFLSWSSATAMAAAMPAGVFRFSLLCFPLGLASYVNTFVAQYHGAGRPRRIGPIVWQGIWVGVLTVPLFLLAIPFAGLPFALAGHDPAVAALESDYYRMLMFGSGAVIIAEAQSAFFTGRGSTRVVMLVECAGALLNAVLAYLWIFGRGGFPEGGIVGAGLSTVAAEWTKVLLYGAIMLRPVYRQKYQLAAGWPLDLPLMWRLWRFGGPSGLQFLVDVAAFTVFILVVGRLGPQAMAASNLAFSINSLAWVPMLGMGIAVATMVGQQLGRNRPDLAARAAWTAFWMTEVYMGAIALAYVLVPDLFMMGHALGMKPEEFAEIHDPTVMLLRFVAAYCVLDAMNVIFASAIRGAGDTRFVLLTSLVMSPLPVAASWWGVTYGGWGLKWCWGVITIWICLLALIYLGRFLQGRWRHMRVIESELLPAAEVAGIGETIEAEGPRLFTTRP